MPAPFCGSETAGIAALILPSFCGMLNTSQAPSMRAVEGACRGKRKTDANYPGIARAYGQG